MLRNLIKMVSVKIYNQKVFYDIKQIHLIPQRLVEEKAQAMDNINEALSKFTTEHADKILEIINNYNINELLGYEISKARANKLITWRMHNGMFKNLNDIFFVKGFGPKVADKFFHSLLSDPKGNKLDFDKYQARLSSFTTPTIDSVQRKIIKSCVSIRIGVNSVTWCRLEVPGQDINAPCLLTHWQYHEISEKKIHLNELIQICLHVHHLIPTADCYVFENPARPVAKANPGGLDQQNIVIQKSQVTAIMSYALASRSSHLNVITERETDKKITYFPNIFYVRRFLTARLFNHLVGTERVSSEETILKMMSTFSNTNEGHDFLPSNQQHPSTEDAKQFNNNGVNFSGRVKFPGVLKKMYSKSPRFYRESLGQSLLLNLAFIRLVLLHDSESIATVLKGNKQTP